MLFCCLWRKLRLLVINISSSSPAINKLRHLLPAVSVTTCGRGAENAGVENAGVENAGVERGGGKCGSGKSGSR